MSLLPSELPILFRDDDFIVVNKFSGLLVHARKIDRFETRFAMQMLRDQIGLRVFSLHRLGGEEFTQGRVERKYLAIVRGFLPLETQVDAPLEMNFKNLIEQLELST